MLHALLLLLLLVGPSDAAAGAPMTVNEAEYHRLQTEMTSLAEREAWVGVEASYRKLRATGIEPTFRDLLAGAHAAHNLGDIAAARERLEAANALQVDRDIIEWMWTLDTTYGRVSIAADPGTQLAMAQAPFDPIVKRAFEHARDTLATEGTFVGYLPAGDYTVGQEALHVDAGQKQATLDVRTARDKKKTGGAGLLQQLF